MTISIRSKENQAPVAESTALETYKNLEATGTLTATDPEGEADLHCGTGPQTGRGDHWRGRRFHLYAQEKQGGEGLLQLYRYR